MEILAHNTALRTIEISALDDGYGGMIGPAVNIILPSCTPKLQKVTLGTDARDLHSTAWALMDSMFHPLQTHIYLTLGSRKGLPFFRPHQIKERLRYCDNEDRVHCTKAT